MKSFDWLPGSVEATTAVKPTSKKRQRRTAAGTRSKSAPTLTADADANPELVKALADWRSTVAKERQLPAYCILNNRTISALAAARPGNKAELLAIKGVGPAKFAEYGQQILQIVGSRGSV